MITVEEAHYQLTDGYSRTFQTVIYVLKVSHICLMHGKKPDIYPIVHIVSTRNQCQSTIGLPS
jgi:hypothetical protein